MRLFQTVGSSALFAVEMAMQFVGRTIVVVAADAVFGRAAAVFDDMEQMVCGEERQRPENRRFVDRFGRGLQVGETECIAETFHRLQYEYPYCRGAYVMVQEQFLALLFVHRLETCCKTHFSENPQCVGFSVESGSTVRVCRSVLRGRCTQSRATDCAVTEEVRATVVDPFGECCDRCGRRNVIRQQGGRNRCGDAIRSVVGFVRVENDFRGVAVAAARRIPFGMFRRFGHDGAVVMTAGRRRTGFHDRATAGERGIGRPDRHQQIDGRQPTGYGTFPCHRNAFPMQK